MASGEQFGPYHLLELIGAGGMGEVYRAYDTGRKRTVALKRLPTHLASDRDYQARFRREAELAARLSEPHIVPIHDYGEIDGRLFIDMRLIVGTDLGRLIQECGPLPPERVVAIVAQLASALDAAHTEGLTHRDVKPSNVLISGGGHDADFAHLVDFGIARDGATPVMTATGSQIGTVEYMAPERLLQGHCDHRVDVYALGCVLYESLTAHKPFTATALAAQMYAHVHTPPPVPSQLRPDLPPGLDAVVSQAMAKDPDQRYQTITELSLAARHAVERPHPGAVSSVHLRSRDLSWPGPTGDTGTTPVRQATRLHQTLTAPTAPTVPTATRRRILVPATVLLAAVAGTAAALLLGDPHTAATPRGPAPGTPATAEGAAVASAALTAPAFVEEIPAGSDAADVAVAPDGRHAYVSNQVQSAGTVYILDTATNKMSGAIPVTAGTDRVAITPDGTRAYVTNNVADGDGGRGTVSVIDAARNVVVTTIAVNKAADVAITPDGHRAFVTENSAGGAVSVIDVASNTVVTRIPVGAKPDGVAITPDGRYAYVTNQNSNSVSVIDTDRNVVTTTLPTGENPIGVAITPDGRRAYIANRAPQGTLTVIDTSSYSTVATISVGRDPINVAITSDGRRVFATNLQANTVSVIDTATGAVTDTIAVGHEPNGIAVAPDGRRAYTANQDSDSVSVINTGIG